MISINMSCSLDGKIATKKLGPVKFSSKLDSQRMLEIRAKHQAIMIGAETFRAHPVPMLAKHKQGMLNIIVSSKLDIPRHTKWLKSDQIEKRIFCGKNAPKAKVEFFRSHGVEVWQSKALRFSPKQMLNILAKHSITKVLLEGGGKFNAIFLEKDLVDHLYLTICPILLGGENSPTIFEGAGLSANKMTSWKLQKMQKHGSELLLRYDRRKNKFQAIQKV